MKIKCCILILLLFSSFYKCYSQSDIYINSDAYLYTHPGSQIAIFGNILNDSRGGFNHQNGGDVYLIRHSENGSGNNIISDGPNSNKLTDNYNKGGSFCRFWNFYTDNTVGKSIPSGTVINSDSGTGHIQIQQEVKVSNLHYFVNGMIWTPRADWRQSFLHYDTDKSNYIGADDSKHIDGYVAKSGSSDFVFPIGDGKIIRNCGINNPDDGIYKAAYFVQNPLKSSKGISGHNIDTNKSNNISEKIIKVSTSEFWDIDGTGNTKIVLSAENIKDDYSDWKNDFKNYDIGSTIISGYDGEWRNLGINEISQLNIDSNNRFSSFAKCQPDSLFCLFTWAVTDSITNAFVKDENKDIENSFIKFSSFDVKKIDYSFGKSGNSVIKIFDLIGNLVEFENSTYSFGINSYVLKNQFIYKGFYLITITNESNQTLFSKITI